MDEYDIEEPLEVVPEKLTKEEWLELKQECVAEGEARGKETAKEKKEQLPSTCTVKGLEKLVQTSTSSLESLKTWTPTPKGFH